MTTGQDNVGETKQVAVDGVPMASAGGRPSESFPVFELGYFDILTGGPNHIRSTNGKVFLQLPNGGPLRWLSLRIVSSAIPIKLKYRCSYKREEAGEDVVAEAPEGGRCPAEDAAYIKKLAFESKIYYRCWLSSHRSSGELERDPAGQFWCPSGRFCGTDEDDRWITALEIKMPPLVDGWRSA